MCTIRETFKTIPIWRCEVGEGRAERFSIIGTSASGKPPGFDPGIRRFESYRPRNYAERAFTQGECIWIRL